MDSPITDHPGDLQNDTGGVLLVVSGGLMVVAWVATRTRFPHSDKASMHTLPETKIAPKNDGF